MYAHLTLIAIAAVPIVSGCGPRIVYDLTPPETPEGRACTAHCQSDSSLCRQLHLNAEQQCRNNYTLMLQNYNACRESGAKLPYCSLQSSSVCVQNFRECFAACGGTVTTRVVEQEK